MRMKHSILCLDDEIHNVDALERAFRKKYNVLKATNPKEALKLLDSHPVTVIISDQRMPVMTGVEFFEESIKTQPKAVRVLLTGYSDMQAIVDAINKGQIYHYVSKPWDPVDLETTIAQAVERYELGETIEKKNLELSEALEELKSLDNTKNQFMALINHELKTPLTSLLSFLELLKQSGLNDEQKIYVEKISRGADRLRQIVFDVMEFLQASTQMRDVHLKDVDLASALRNKLASLEQKTSAKGHIFQIDLSQAECVADEMILDAILTRLFDNMIIHSPEGSKLFVALSSSDTHALLTLKNPLAAENKTALERIFAPFTIQHPVLNHSKGLGLSLSLVKALCQLTGIEASADVSAKMFEVSLKIPKP